MMIVASAVDMAAATAAKKREEGNREERVCVFVSLQS